MSGFHLIPVTQKRERMERRRSLSRLEVSDDPKTLSVVLWDLSKADVPAALTPGLAESWSVDPDNPERWVFNPRNRPLTKSVLDALGDV